MSPAEGDAATVIDPGPLGAFAVGALSFGDAPQAMPAGLLADRVLLDRLVGHLQSTYACHDRQAAASFWSQLYIGRLVMAGVSATIACGHPLPLALETTRISFCPATGRPLMFHLDAAAVIVTSGGLLDPLVGGHLAPLVALLRRQTGLSARLLWENAAWVLVWSLGEAARLQPACRTLVDGLLAGLAGADPAPLAAMARAALDGLPLRRRVCCLRYRVPSLDNCAGLCPLATGPVATRAEDHVEHRLQVGRSQAMGDLVDSTLSRPLRKQGGLVGEAGPLPKTGGGGLFQASVSERVTGTVGPTARS